MNASTYQFKTNLLKLWAETKAYVFGNLIFKISPNTLIHNPTVDFRIIPANFDLRKLTSSKVGRIAVEVGTGNGGFLSYVASRNNRTVFFGFEIAKDYFLKTKNNIESHLCLNAKVSIQDAFEVIRDKFSNDSISKIYINFPDPWPKKKHWRRRFLTEEKLPTILKKMKKEGEIVFVTDHMDYADFVEKICVKFKEKNLITFEVSEGVPSNYPETKYFRKWKSQGKKDFRTIRIQKLKTYPQSL